MVIWMEADSSSTCDQLLINKCSDLAKDPQNLDDPSLSLLAAMVVQKVFDQVILGLVEIAFVVKDIMYRKILYVR